MKVGIIGCGWLGLSLGKSLVENGHSVIGSTTNQEKFEVIEQAGITPILLKLDPMPIGEDFNRIFDCEVLVVNIPPGRKKHLPSFYEEEIKYLRYLIDQHHVPKVIFISSTSFYPNTNGSVDELTESDVNNGSNEAIVRAENQIRQASAELVVLRCGGLMGGDRISGKWFAGKETSGAYTPVNFIHRADVILIINNILENPNPKLGTFNLVAPQHPTRQEVYEAMAEKYGFEKPIWIEPTLIPHKIVTGQVREVLDYQFNFPDPLLF